MFLVAFALILSVLTALNNKVRKISSDNAHSYQFDRVSIIVILSLFGLGILLNLTSFLFKNHIMIALGAYSFIAALGIVITNQLRIQKIEERRKDIEEVYTILDKIFKKKPDEELDFNEVPFEIVYDKDDKSRIASIIVEVDNPDKFTDYILTDSVNRLNEFLNYFQWIQTTDFPKRKCTFIGKKKPPSFAEFPGSDLRPWNWIPLGVGSNGEVGWNLGADSKEIGKSAFRFDDTGELAGTTDISKAPQSLTLGSTGGGKAIWINQDIEIPKKANLS